MTDNIDSVKKPAAKIASLANVSLFSEVVETVLGCPEHLTPIAIFNGFSGYGKTFSATKAANIYGAFYVQIGGSWDTHALCDAMLEELGSPMKGTVAAKAKKIIEILALSADRPLIIDEFDHVVRKSRCVEIVREIVDKTHVPTVIIGEENLPFEIAKYERFHNRILAWQPALPASFDDTKALAELYYPDLMISEGLLKKVFDACGTRVRRICTNLDQVSKVAVSNGLSEIGLDEWGRNQFPDAQPPQKRRIN